MNFESDFLVIGSGIAGLTVALKLADHGSVTVLAKREAIESNTRYAQGGIASVFDPDDSFDQHIQDTENAGAGLCHADAVRMIVERGPVLINELDELGVNFTRGDSGDFDLGREGGHHQKRVVHVKDHTGLDVQKALIAAVKNSSNITLLDHHVAVDLITEHHVFVPSHARDSSLNCWGAYVLDVKRKRVQRFTAKATIMAAGGVGQVYLHTTNPNVATGDGVAMCYRAGASIGNMEFMQFHPTTLYHPDADSFLITEALRGFGGRLVNKKGEPFVEKYHPMGSLAPRDIVARSIDSELKKSGERCVFLDVTHKDADEIKNRFPVVYETCKKYKIDITIEPIPVVPAAHYSCGGVITDLLGHTDITGLYACGEVGSTGVHGANRLASNSLLEALVYAEQCAISASGFVKSHSFQFPPIPVWDYEGTFNSEEWVLISHDLLEIKNLMWDYVGIVRSTLRLERALSRMRLIRHEIENFYRRTTVTEGSVELRNLATVAQIIVQSALMRKESRGLHYTTDYPKSNDDDFVNDTIIKQQTI
jgi:L-aspartate oxidase